MPNELRVAQGGVMPDSGNEEWTHDLSVVIPCYDEAKTIREVLVRVAEAALEYSKQVIVVDDGSRDGSADVIRDTCGGLCDILIVHKRNQGKGAALRSGFAAATGRFVIVQDADLEYSPCDYGRMLGPLVNSGADVVFGSRFVGNDPHRVLYFWHYVANRVITLLSNCLTNLNLTDIETGYKAFRTKVLRRVEVEENRFGFEPEVTAKVARLGAVIYEVGISYNARTYAQGKKIGWRDGVRAIFAILKYNLFRRRLRPMAPAAGRLGDYATIHMAPSRNHADTR